MTIKDIAKECGCGLGTVSRVLNNHPDVSEQMRERVLAVVNKYGFVSNQSAKMLRVQDNRVIVILERGSSNPLFSALTERIQKLMEPLPYITNVIVLDESENEAARAYQVCQNLRPLGLIFAGGTPDLFASDFAKIQVPSVVITGLANDVQNARLSSVSTDDKAAAEQMAQYLVSRGHRDICVIGGDLAQSDVARRRFDGFLSVMQRNGIPFDQEKQYVTAKYTMLDGAAAAEHLVRTNPSVTALFTIADVMAIGAIRQLADMGYRVPEDVSVTGFDGIDIAHFFCPRITTIRQLIGELAEEGLDALLDNIERKRPCRHRLIPFEFVTGDSVTEPRQ